MSIHKGSPVQPDAAGCCAGLLGISSSGYQPCASEPTVSGTLSFLDTGETWHAFACERHATVVEQPRPLSAEDIVELNRRIRLTL